MAESQGAGRRMGSTMARHLRFRRADWIAAGAACLVFLVAVFAMSFIHKDRVRPAEIPNGPMVTVNQYDRKFIPDELTIARGTIVQFTNTDRFTHHIYVKSPTLQFDSGEEPIGKSVYVQFDHPGAFHVRCAIHPTMDLLVTVK